MDLPDVVTLLEMLADGVNPITGERLPVDSVYNNSQVVRALFTAARELRERTTAPVAAATRPTKAGRPWSVDEDQQLRQEFAAKIPIPEIGRQHERTRGAITSRLMRLGLLSPYGSDPPGTGMGFAPVDPEYTANHRTRRGGPWAAEEDAELLKGYDAGLSIEELAERLDRHQNAVDVRLCKLGRG